jgi:superoxide dismutase
LNHTFYWNCLSPQGGGQPEGPLAAALEQKFGSFDQFKQQFNDAAKGLFGSGWTWLVKDASGNIRIEPMSNAGTPIQKGSTAANRSFTRPRSSCPKLDARMARHLHEGAFEYGALSILE